jgi:hypothetical protein
MVAMEQTESRFPGRALVVLGLQVVVMVETEYFQLQPGHFPGLRVEELVEQTLRATDGQVAVERVMQQRAAPAEIQQEALVVQLMAVLRLVRWLLVLVAVEDRADITADLEVVVPAAGPLQSTQTA